jgi:hypothetical protein
VRTTLDIDDEALSIARDVAAVEGISIGKAVSKLVRAAVAPRPVQTVGRIPSFAPRQGARAITGEAVDAALDEP